MKELHVLNLGAGVQSTMLYLLACEGHPVMPHIDAAIFADVGEEPAAVYEHLKWLQSLDGPPILVRSAGNRLGDGLIHGIIPSGYSYETTSKRDGKRRRFASIPAYTLSPRGDVGMTRRQCTAEYKVAVVEKCIRRELVGLKPRQRFPLKDVKVVQYMGLSADEVKRVVRVRARFDRDIPWSTPKFPLFETNTTRAIAKRWLEPRVPHVVPRSACVFCPYHNQAEWRAVKDVPGDWARAVEVDDALRMDSSSCTRDINDKLFCHASCVPLRDADLGADGDDRQMEFGFLGECEGMCGV